jgi:hypothetical protein
MEDRIMKKIYVEDSNGLLYAYSSKHNPFICGATKEATMERNLAEWLCKATQDFNQSQDLLYKIYHDKD